MKSQYPDKKFNIIGAGIIAYIASYLLMKAAEKDGQKIKITIFEKNNSIVGTTVMHLVPSLTPDEMLAVIPSAHDLMIAAEKLFSIEGGIRIDDVPDVGKSIAGQKFIEQVKIDGAPQNDELVKNTQKLLLEIGKRSMEIWDEIYFDADEEFKQIMIESNYNPCREVDGEHKILHQGYRIDLILSIKNAGAKATNMAKNYNQIGFASSKVLSPDEAVQIDPYLNNFADTNSHLDENNQRVWNDDAAALWRPGGCINTGIFLPKLHEYLTKKMGTYVSDEGREKKCFSVKYACEVVGVEIAKDQADGEFKIEWLRFANGLSEHKKHKHPYQNQQYLFFPGEAVGTLAKFGFKQPADAGFAGASLIFNISVPQDKEEQFKNLNHCMEVHEQGIVLAWQAKYDAVTKEILLGVAGSKAFYADIVPKSNEDFCQNRNLLQLNVVNQIVPEIIGLAFGYDTKNKTLTNEDLKFLEEKNIAKRWVERRSLSFDGAPTIGILSTLDGRKIVNAKTINHASCGGVSYSPALVELLQKLDKDNDLGKYTEILDPNREARK